MYNSHCDPQILQLQLQQHQLWFHIYYIWILLPTIRDWRTDWRTRASPCHHIYLTCHSEQNCLQLHPLQRQTKTFENKVQKHFKTSFGKHWVQRSEVWGSSADLRHCGHLRLTVTAQKQSLVPVAMTTAGPRASCPQAERTKAGSNSSGSCNKDQTVRWRQVHWGGGVGVCGGGGGLGYLYGYPWYLALKMDSSQLKNSTTRQMPATHITDTQTWTG